MAHATLRSDVHDDAPNPLQSADQLLAEIQRLYRELQALPNANEGSAVKRASVTYLALEARIRWYADQYTALTA